MSYKTVIHSVLYYQIHHEASIINLLETIMFHQVCTHSFQFHSEKECTVFLHILL